MASHCRNEIAGAAGLLALFCATLSVGAQTQNPQTNRGGPCGASNGGGPNSTNYYGGGNPCAFRYSVPAENLNRLLNEVPYCSMFSRTQVNCSQALRGNYGQAPIDSPSGASEQGLPAEEYWKRAVVLIDRNDYRDAIPLLQRAAQAGHARAQATLGIAYQDGNGVRRDDKAAAHWFGLAAAQGHRAAQYALGGMYEEGEGGLPRDKKKSAELYLASAKSGFDKAQLIVGIGYLTGDGLPNDRRQAMAWLKAAGAQGSDFARHLTIILADRSAPAQFANIDALYAYLAKLRQQEMAREAARNPGGGIRQDDNVVARIIAANELNKWRQGRHDYH